MHEREANRPKTGAQSVRQLATAAACTARTIEHLRTGEDHSQSHLMDWFTGLSGYDPGHQTQVREEVMSLGDHGWLTMIAPTDGS